MDVKTAFLNGELNEDIYMEIPEGQEAAEERRHGSKLQKALYGLHISPKKWNEKFAKEVKKLGFQRQ